jgi:hypothetical protein
MAIKFHAIRVDDENNAERWWDALREARPDIATSLERNGCAVVSDSVLHSLESLPGWSDGPEYAKTPLIDYGDAGDGYGDVVAGRHQVFEE